MVGETIKPKAMRQIISQGKQCHTELGKIRWVIEEQSLKPCLCKYHQSRPEGDPDKDDECGPCIARKELS